MCERRGANLGRIGLAALMVCLGSGAVTGEVRNSLPVDPEQEEQLLKDVGSGFKIKHTGHFIIAYDGETRTIEDLTNRLEHTCYLIEQFCRVNDFSIRPLDRKLEVVFFNDREGYDQYSKRLQFNAEGTNGVFYESLNRSTFLNIANDDSTRQLHASIDSARQNLDRLSAELAHLAGVSDHVVVEFSDGRRLAGPAAEVRYHIEKEIEVSRRQLKQLASRGERTADYETQAVVQHETTHQVFFNMGVHVRGAANPKWFVEGLATLFETPPSRTGTSLGTTNQARLRDFRLAVRGDSTKMRLTWRDYFDAIEAGRLIELRDLVADESVFRQRGNTGAMIYANTWALMHFLQRTQREELGSYMRAVSQRKPGEDVTPEQELALFETHFGEIDHIFQRRFAMFILGLNVRTP